MIKKDYIKGEIGGLFIYKKLLMILLTLLLISSIAIVSAIDTDSSDNQILSVEKSVNQNIF